MMTLEDLNKKLDKLVKIHGDMSIKIDEIRVEILRLKVANNQAIKPKVSERSSEKSLVETETETKIPAGEVPNYNHVQPHEHENYPSLLKRGKRALESNFDSLSQMGSPNKSKFDLEKLIGENLINKIGILVLIIGVAIGGKYSIDNNLINPLTRIILGYITGVALLVTGIRLQEKYKNFSAVLVSGAMAIFYFITFFAYNFYGLMSQYIAFGLMVIFTIFTVLAALNYNKQIIAHLGLVGAVAVPFLLSGDSENSTFLFSYILLINLGILYISLFKRWAFLFYSGFCLTWFVYLAWFFMGYETQNDFNIAAGFLFAYFLLFYAVFVTYKLKNIEQYRVGDITILLLNASIYYGCGYYLIDGANFNFPWLGIFTLGNAIIHFAVAKLIQSRLSSDTNLFYLVIGLVLVFLTLAIPVQLDGSYVTIMWMAMSSLLFWIGRTKNVPFYEYMSYALIAIALISLIEDWDSGYRIAYQGSDRLTISPILNTTFLESIISLFCLCIINRFAHKSKRQSSLKLNPEILKLSHVALPVILLVVLYYTFYNEIVYYFNQSIEDSIKTISKDASDGFGQIKNRSQSYLRDVWLVIYSMVFASGTILFASKRIKSSPINIIILAIASLAILAFLTRGLMNISDLRKTYIDQVNAEYFDIGTYYIWMRYVGIGVFLILVWLVYNASKKYEYHPIYLYLKDVLLSLIALWLLSSELIHWLDFSPSRNEYGLGISILWGIFSATNIAFGIWKRKKHLRLFGIALFGITLIKLFFYDLANLSTISKTIVLVALGVLLLATSFLYNKYTIDEYSDEKI